MTAANAANLDMNFYSGKSFLKERFEFNFADKEDCTHFSNKAAMFQISPQLDQLTQLMDAVQLRHRVISQNLANVNTPGYQRLEVQFEDALAEQIQSGNGSASAVAAPRIVAEQGLSSRSDGNNVDIDREIGQLNRNSMMFQTYSQLLASQFDQMRRATRSG